jgi:hypothetical protein
MNGFWINCFRGLGTTHNPTYPKVSGFTISTTVVKDGEEHKIEMVEHPVFNYVENICGELHSSFPHIISSIIVIYFTLEYLLRFWVAPQKGQFVREFLNVIDLLAIAPFVFELILIFVSWIFNFICNPIINRLAFGGTMFAKFGGPF